jgi:hypothetical protein
MDLPKELEELISKGEGLIAEKYDSPRVDIWRANAIEFVSNNYSVRIADSFDRVFNHAQVIYGDMDWDAIHREDMRKGVEFLQALRQQKPVSSYKPEVSQENDRPSFIKIAPGASAKGLKIINSVGVGDADFINNEGELEDLDMSGTTHIVSTKKSATRWWEETWVQVLFVLGALAGIIGLVLYFA